MGQSMTGITALLILCLGSVLFSCNVSKQTSNTSSREDSPDESPRMLFLNYEITRDTINSTCSARLINMVETRGSLKHDTNPPLQPVKGDLLLEILDADQQLMKTIYIPNPLDKQVEFVNDARELEYKIISLDTAEFSVRLQMEPGSSSTLLKIITGPDSESNVLLKAPIL